MNTTAIYFSGDDASTANRNVTGSTTLEVFTSEATTGSGNESLETSTTLNTSTSDFTTKEMTMNAATNTGIPAETTALFSSTLSISTSNTNQTQSNLIGSLEIYEFAIVLAVSLIAVIVIVIIVVFVCRKRFKRSGEKKQEKMRKMWNMETGGAEVQMINLTRRQEKWQSLESVNDTITKAVVVEPSTVNVFTSDNDAYLNSPKTSHLDRRSTASSLRSKQSRHSLKSNNSDASSMFKKSKINKALTKVEGPKINRVTPAQSANDLDHSSEEETDVSSRSSVFIDTLNPQMMGTFKSRNSSPQRSMSSLNSSNPSPGKQSIQESLPVARAKLIAPLPPVVPLIPTGDDTNKDEHSPTNFTKAESEKENSFLHTSSTSKTESSSRKSKILSSNELPPPPPPPPNQAGQD